MEKKEPKKHRVRNFFIDFFIIIILLIVGLYLYSKYLGVKGIIVKEYRLASEKIPSNFSGNKIIYFSDLLYGSTVDIEDLEKIKDEINMFKPDLIIFGGDLISKNYKLKTEEKEDIINILLELDTKLGKYAALGMLDNGEVKTILESANFKVLENSSELIYNAEENPICLMGVGSYIKGEYNLETITNCAANYKILISHEPDILDRVKDLDIDVFLSGNSLGGEIYIPFYGPFEKFEGSLKYYQDTKVGNINAYISSGIGTKKYAARLFNKPSFNLFRLKYKEQNS